MTGKDEPRIEEVRIETPSRAIMKGQNFGTMAADDVVCTVNSLDQTCTLIFLQRHPSPKEDIKGYTLDSIETEIRLEVKLPLESVWRLAFYLRGIFDDVKKIQKHGTQKLYFGPTFVRNDGEK